MNNKLRTLKRKSLLLLIIPLFVIGYNTNAQDGLVSDSSIVHFVGKLTDNTGKVIPFAHVINLRRGYATISDTSGKFSMLVLRRDSIRISAIGFITRYVSIKRHNPVNDTLDLHILMEKKTYDLSTVNIYELRWQVFKSEFMEEKVEEDETSERITIWMNSLFPAGELRMIYQGSRGVGFQLPYKGKAEKQRRKVAALEKKYNIIQPKFNDELITNLTGLKGESIYDFINYCNFDEGFLVHSSEYQIIEAIHNKWGKYKKVMDFRKEFNDRNR
ncbi:MAG: hypothetical protein ABFS35_03815 [Bacteroidota bacterium]